MKNQWIHILLFLLLATDLCTQTPVFNPVNLSTDYVIHDIAQDKTGFLWMATDQGILYFNGIEDQVIMDTLPVKMTYSLLIEGDTLYAGRDHGVVTTVHIPNKSIISHTHLKVDARVSSLATGKNKKRYIATYGDGLFIIQPEDTVHLTSSHNFTSEYIYDLAVLPDGRVICATDRGCNVLGQNNNVINQLTELPDIIITHLYSNNDSLVWASSYDRGVFSIDVENYNVKDYPFEREMKVLDLIPYKSGALAATEYGIFYLDESYDWRPFEQEGTLKKPFESLFIDEEKNLWVAGRNNPLWRANLYFSIFHTDIQPVQAIGVDNTNLFLGTSGGLYFLEKSTGKTSLVIPDINITILKCSKDLHWVGTYSKGIYILDNNYRMVYHMNAINGLKDNTVLDIEPVDSHTTYVSTLAGIVKITYDFSSSFRIVQDSSYSSDMGYSYVMDIYEDKNKTIWFGRDKAGIIKKDEESLKEILYLDNAENKLGSVYSIHESQDGGLWFSSVNQGLVRSMNDSLSQMIPLTDKKEAYTSIVPLKRNNLLLIRNSSVDLYDVDRDHIMYFNKEIGILPDQPFLNNYCLDGDYVWFVHNNQIYRFDMPAGDQKIHPSTQIDRVEVNLDEVSLTRNQYAQSENNFRFTFTGAWMSDPSKLTYAYMLEGFDPDWRQTKDRVVSYPHLPPNEYTFRVKSAENNIFSDEPEVEYSFVIKKAFYNTYWFYALVIGLVSVVVYFLIKRDQRERALRAELAHKKVETQLINLKSQLNPHFLFNSFNTLIGLVEEDTNRGIKYVEHLTDFYRSILEIGKEELITLERELDLVKLYSFLLHERFGDGLRINFGELPSDALIPPLTLQMLIENAVKHNIVSKKNPLTIEVYCKDNNIVVKNNLNPKISKEPSTSIGLQNIRRRYLLLANKAIHIQQDKSDFRILLPIIE